LSRCFFSAASAFVVAPAQAGVPRVALSVVIKRKARDLRLLRFAALHAMAGQDPPDNHALRRAGLDRPSAFPLSSRAQRRLRVLA